MTCYRQLMNQFLTRHEGLGVNFKDDYNHKVTREVFVLSSLLLMTEDENLIEKDRKTILDEVLDLLFKQIGSCWMEHLQEQYVEALKVAYVVICQVWPKDKQAFEKRLCMNIDSLYWAAFVLSATETEISEEACRIIKNRWTSEHLVLYVRAQQIHRLNLYNALKEWVESF